MHATEESRITWLSNLFRDHDRYMKSARRSRWSFFTLIAAFAVYICVLPFLRNPTHIAIAAAIFLLFALQYIIVELIDERPGSPLPARLRRAVSSRTSPPRRNDMDNPFDCNKLNEHCETLRRELLHASQNGHLDPLRMTEQDEKNIIHHVNELSKVCSKVLVYMNSMKKTREALFS
ncbi:MAG: hypothetical protein OXL36_16880 [Bryobacterales bacterium]|nr:hypothetical protein [Bryobacterales bacterium]MDE0296080.1 hypothetical protein [Bryobacterales bacterium]